MAKPKYEVVKIESITSPHWAIWMGTNDAVFWDEDSATLACEALNMHSGIKKLKRKAKDLFAALESFNTDD